MKFFTAAMLPLVAAPSFAFAQIDASALRIKYGTPLDRETFMVRPGIGMVVDYGPAKQICKIQLPPAMDIRGAVPSAVTKQQIAEILSELIPSSMRGKESNRSEAGTPGFSVESVEYENVILSETQVKGTGGTATTAFFKDPACPRKTITHIDGPAWQPAIP